MAETFADLASYLVSHSGLLDTELGFTFGMSSREVYCSCSFPIGLAVISECS